MPAPWELPDPKRAEVYDGASRARMTIRSCADTERPGYVGHPDETEATAPPPGSTDWVAAVSG